jgi:hypothetical protein
MKLRSGKLTRKRSPPTPVLERRAPKKRHKPPTPFIHNTGGMPSSTPKTVTHDRAFESPLEFSIHSTPWVPVNTLRGCVFSGTIDEYITRTKTGLIVNSTSWGCIYPSKPRPGIILSPFIVGAMVKYPDKWKAIHGDRFRLRGSVRVRVMTDTGDGDDRGATEKLFVFDIDEVTGETFPGKAFKGPVIDFSTFPGDSSVCINVDLRTDRQAIRTFPSQGGSGYTKFQ